MSTSSLLSTFPIEIVHEVIRNSNVPTLANWTLVSRAFLSFAGPLLYHTVTLERANDVIPFLRRLVSLALDVYTIEELQTDRPFSCRATSQTSFDLDSNSNLLLFFLSTNSNDSRFSPCLLQSPSRLSSTCWQIPPPTLALAKSAWESTGLEPEARRRKRPVSGFLCFCV